MQTYERERRDTILFEVAEIRYITVICFYIGPNEEHIRRMGTFRKPFC
jgi:hypothetical protein